MGDEGGEPPDGVAERARLRQLGFRRVRGRAVGADGVEPLVQVDGGAQVVVDAVGVRPDRAHQAHGLRLVGQHPDTRRGGGGGCWFWHAMMLSRIKQLASVRQAW
jgi:hypothetical protein